MALLRKLQCMNPNMNTNMTGDMYMNTNMNTNLYVNTKVSANGQFRAPDGGGGGGGHRPMTNRWTQPQVMVIIMQTDDHDGGVLGKDTASGVGIDYFSICYFKLEFHFT